MRLPKPLLISLVAVLLFALFVFLNDEAVRVSFLVTSATLPAWAMMVISFCFGMVPGLALGIWGARRRH